MFAVINVAEPERHIEIHQTGNAAGEHARKLNDDARAKGDGARFRVVPVKSETVEMPDWHAREIARFVSGEYVKLPWHDEPWVKGDHFAHVSLDDGAKVAFTPTAVHGESDRQLRMRPGKYLTAYYAETLSADAIRDWCSKFSAEHETNDLQFADTPDEIQRVYENGPNSCMSHSADDYSGPCHPVRVYGAGDLAVAYIERDGEVTARAVCWPAKLRYGRVYGDEGRLVPLLEDAGYTDDGDFSGARLLRIECGNQFVAPYLDDPNYNAGDDGKYLIIGDGEFECRNTDGLTEEPGYTCDNCGGRVPEDDTCFVDGETWCEYCRDYYAFSCYDCHETYAGEPQFTTNRGRHICARCASDYSECHGCNEVFADDEITITVCGDAHCSDCARDLERTPCGELAYNKDDCDCRECEDHRDSLLPENFELADGDDVPATVVVAPKHKKMRKPSPTVLDDPRQFELPLIEPRAVLCEVRPARGYSVNVVRTSIDTAALWQIGQPHPYTCSADLNLAA